MATETPLIHPLGDVVIVSPTLPPPSGGPFGYSASDNAPTWNLAQWGIGGSQLPNFTTYNSRRGSQSVSVNQSASIVISKSKTDIAVSLSQNGTSIPCNDSRGPLEFDLFLAPNDGTGSFKGAELGVASTPVEARLLGTVKTVNIAFTMQLTQGATSSLLRCDDNSGSALVSLILTNDTAGQTLFYQLSLSAFCEQNNNSGSIEVCGQSRPEPSYFSTANPYGMDDFITLLGSPWMVTGAKSSFMFDVRPRLMLALSTIKGIDTDPAHWQIHTMYVGQHIWGDVSMMTMWSNVQLYTTN